MANLIRMQDNTMSSISKGFINFKKASKDRITAVYLQTRLDNLEQQWNLFLNSHRKLVYEMKSEDLEQSEYIANDVYNVTEELYLDYKTLLKEKLLLLKPKEESNSNPPEARKVNVRLPDISLPKFSGKYSDWVNFKDMFKSLIHQNESLDDVQRMHYLKGSLTGEAETIVKSLSITGDNYRICWDKLVARYDNKKSMANSIIRRLMTQKALSQESATSIRQLLDTTNECLQALSNMGVNTTSWDLIIIYVISQKLDTESRAKWEAKMSESGPDLPTYKNLQDFLEARFRSLEYKLVASDKPQEKTAIKSAHAATTVTAVCAFCSEAHKLCNCKKFSKESSEQRRKFVQETRLCFNCLSPSHSVYKCTVSTNGRICKKRHHTLLHPKSSQEGGRPDQSGEASKFVAVTTETKLPPNQISSNENEKPEVVTTCFSTARSTVLLATALVNVQTKSGSASVLRSLLDQGSQASFVTESAAQLLGLKRSRERVEISGVGSSGCLESQYSAFITINSRINPSFSLNIKVHVLEKLTKLLPSNKVTVDFIKVKSLPTLELADPTFNFPGGIDLLLGAEVYSKIMMAGLIQGPNGDFIAQQTKLGWVLSGVIQNSSSNKQTEINPHFRCHMVVKTDEIDGDSLLKRFWELEAEPAPTRKILTQEESACEELFAATTKRDEQGRYIVKLPFKGDDPSSAHGDSRDIARKRFLMLEKRLSSNTALKTEYSKVINEYLTMGHMEVCADKDKPDAVYLPHHAVVREDKTTTKVRVVFDASCKGKNGASLNSDLMIGPTLQPELRHLVMRWRCYPISLVADIVKMYRQVKVADDDADFQRLFWRESPDEDLQHFRLLRVTFGTSAAPYLAVRALQQIAHDEGSQFPLACSRVLNDFYMDDFMSGCHSVEDGTQVYFEMTQLLERGAFPLQKWSSNNRELMERIGDKDSNKDQILELKTDEIMKILGLIWNRRVDEFRFKVNLPPLSNSLITKRKTISDIARLYDPLGWLAPAITTAKIFIQKLWLSGIGWDDPLPPTLLQDWLKFREDLIHLESFTIPRWIHASKTDQCLELHGFSDASNAAYAAVVYSRVVDERGKVHVTLITSKTRVAPIRQVSIPRLELCGATLLATLLREVGDVLEVPKQRIHAWTDSSIVLAWLRSHPSRWKTFVANRVADILTTMDGNQWSHVVSEQNPADAASRGLLPSECVRNPLWKEGPKWLKGLEIDYTNKTGNPKNTNLEEKKVKVKCHVVVDKEESDDGEKLLSRFSSLRKLTRVMSFCRRVLLWKNPEKQKDQTLNKGLTVKEIKETLLTCIRVIQGKYFQEEIECLLKSKVVSKKSKLSSLNPYIDGDQILRVGGRIHNASIKEDMKHPIILPHNAHFANLLIDDAHQRTLHGGPQLMLNYLRTMYWIVGAKSAVRQFMRKCVICIRHSNQFSQQMMGQLPTARVTAHRPFHRSGVDYAGPISIRPTKGRGYRSTKGYIAVFVCMATKAIHLELVSDMTSEAFLAAFKRFTARRGHIAEMWSDNGTTFVGSARQLAELLDVESSSVAVEISDWLTSNGTSWHFIPPHSPNFGGLWEAGVKSTKFHLARVIGTTTLTFEEMTTTLAQIEACLNSRPISQLPSDAKDSSPLTPGHFLVGEPLVLVPEMNYEASNISSLKRWHLTQRMVQEFWRRWSEEYLTQLQHRHKWVDQVSEPEVGDVVLVKEDGLPPARWLYGRVISKHPGTDGCTRVVSLRYKDNIIKRPTSKLIVLPKPE